MATITGTSLADNLTGTAAADTISGLGGDDTIYGGDGGDSISGGDGADQLDGGPGNDILNGNAGNDWLTGWYGNDTFTGGTGVDEFVPGYGNDEITDFQNGTDLIILNEMGIIDLNQLLSFAVQVGSNVVITPKIDEFVLGSLIIRNVTLAQLDIADFRFPSQSGNSITGTEGNDLLYSLGGDFSINWAFGGDDIILTGPVGLDRRIMGGEGNDTVIVTDPLRGGYIMGEAGTDTLILRPRGAQTVDGSVRTFDFQYSVTNQIEFRGFEILKLESQAGTSFNVRIDLISYDMQLTTLIGGAGSDTVVTRIYNAIMPVLTLNNWSQDDTVEFQMSVVDYNLALGEDHPGLYRVVGSDIAHVITGTNGREEILGGAGDDTLDAMDGADRLSGGLGNDSLTGGSNVDTAVFSGNRSAYTITQTSTGVFQVVGPDGTDTLTTIEYAQFADQTLRLLPGTGTAVDFNAPASTWMGSIRDFDGNNLGGASSWKLIGAADIDGDGDLDRILVNREIGRFAEVATGPDGLVYFSDHGWAGETRVVGIYIDPEVVADPSKAGGPFDSQRRFQNDLFIDNIAGVLGAGDYDHDGLQEVYFRLTDGTAYLHAYMHADGNIRYANYQSQQQVVDFLTANGWSSSTWAGWFPSGGEAPPKPSSFAADSFGWDEVELASLSATTYADDGMARWTVDHLATQPLV